MAKHKLFTTSESSPQLNSSLDKSFSGRKRVHPAIEVASKAGAKKSRIIQKKGGSPEKILHPSTSHDAAKESRHPIQSTSSSLEKVSISDSDSSSEWNRLEVPGFFSSFNQKLPYTFVEDEEILKYVLRGENIFRVGSLSLWKELEYRKDKPKRTYQSLKNRFQRNIKPHLFTTFRHMVTDESIIQKIVMKFPELKKQVGRKESLSSIRLPQRVPNTKVSEPKVSSTSIQETREPQKSRETAQEQLPETVLPERDSSTSNNIEGTTCRRKVRVEGNSITVAVNLNFKEPPSSCRGIYETFEEMKSREWNELVRCPTCKGSGVREVEDSLSSDAESDAFISNSVESKKSGKVSSERKSSESRKERTSNPIVESFSQSLLNEVDALGELDENEGQNEEGKSADSQGGEVLRPEVVRTEADSTPKDPSPEKGGDTESVYESAVAEFHQLIDSDEEEILVKKCLKRNMKKIGFEYNVLSDATNVDSYFLKSSSVDFDSADLRNLSENKSPSVPVSSLVENMMNMIRATKDRNGGNPELQPSS